MVAALAMAPPAAGQGSYVHGRVLASESEAPLVGAVVTALRARRSTNTDRLGRFNLWVTGLPDSLVVGFIGRIPDTLRVDSASIQGLRIVLPKAPDRLTDITVSAPDQQGVEDITSVGSWQLPTTTVRAVPPAIEPDVFRTLALVPAVSFSTPLSSRPLIRGYDASESGLKIDGHEVLNLYHIGRAFSAFPADAAQQVSVMASPPPVAEGGTLAGIVDITGQGGAAEGTDGGVDLSLVSASGWIGGGRGVRWFGGARAVHLTTVNAVRSNTIPYNFQDFYGSAIVSGRSGPRGRITAFASRDHLLDRDLGTGMDWNNLLLGTRWDLLTKRATTVTMTTSITRFAQDVEDIPARRSRLDLRNRFSRLTSGIELGFQTPSSRFTLGSGLGFRRVANRVVPLSGGDFVATDVSLRRLELGAYGEWSHLIGSTVIQAGARIDAAGSAHVFQPRARFQTPIGNRMTLSAGIGRTGRLHHLVSDPQSEPDIAFYDFWLSAGHSGVPVPKADHLSLDLDGGKGSLVWRVSGYLSRASGLAELRPSTEPALPGGDQFRYGRGRTAGLELHLGLRSQADRANSFSIMYVLSRSERHWGQDWVDWSQDRRHLVRAFGHARLSRRWSVFGTFEATSAIPLTPVEQVIFIGTPPLSGSAEPGVGFPAYVYGRENSARGIGTGRADVGARFGFKGIAGSRASLGLSVINLGFGPVAPVQAASPVPDFGAPGGPDIIRVEYVRLFDLPAIPTVTFRMEF